MRTKTLFAVLASNLLIGALAYANQPPAPGKNASQATRLGPNRPKCAAGLRLNHANEAPRS